ncbi:hypothetical protein CTI12_AA009070 [Artemisia annua]|uniref:Uncharacterized protein n=1 Tax=Artemisia annua TaxID=35608 RepID=A0A2U1QN50_ARTAN|nr:hypothetical protein CTI12_AA009070 [Artemisia annua]
MKNKDADDTVMKQYMTDTETEEEDDETPTPKPTKKPSKKRFSEEKVSDSDVNDAMKNVSSIPFLSETSKATKSKDKKKKMSVTERIAALQKKEKKLRKKLERKAQKAARKEEERKAAEARKAAKAEKARKAAEAEEARKAAEAEEARKAAEEEAKNVAEEEEKPYIKRKRKLGTRKKMVARRKKKPKFTVDESPKRVTRSTSKTTEESEEDREKEKSDEDEKEITDNEEEPLSDATSNLFNERKRCLKEMGFETMINFPLNELPGSLGFYVLEKFHPKSMELRLERGSIKVTRQKVHDMLGVPMGSRKLNEMEPREWDDEFITRWEQQYYKLGKKEKATPALIAKEINRTSNADFMFKINFLMLFASTMGTLDSGGKCPYNVLRNVKEDDDIADIDWCGYILDCLEGSKHNWKDVKKSGNYYYGPLTLLNLLYLDSTHFPELQVMRHRPSVRSWNTAMMKQRIELEKKQKCLGKLEHHGKFNQEEDQSDCINLYQGADVYFEEEIEDETSPATKEKNHNETLRTNTMSNRVCISVYLAQLPWQSAKFIGPNSMTEEVTYEMLISA